MRPFASTAAFFLISFFTFFGSSPAAEALLWTEHGPDGGAVWAIVADPQSATLYTVVGGDVYRSTDQAATWSRLFMDDVSNPIRGEALALDPLDPNILYVGSQNGVYRSSDRGLLDSWAYFTDGLEDAGAILKLAVDPVDPQTLYAGTVARGVFRSQDGGRSWTDASPDFSSIHSLWVHAENPARIYAAGVSGFARSDDRGESWNAIEGLPDAAVRKATYRPGQPSRLYASTDAGFYFSDDSGDSWYRPPFTEPGANIDRTVTDLAFDPQQPDFMYASTFSSPSVFRSQDAGATWERVGRALPNGTIFSIAVDPQDQNVIYAGSLGDGLYRSNDRGETWESTNRSMQSAIAYAVAVNPQNPSDVFAATFGGVHRSRDWGFTWEEDNGPSDAYVRDLVAHPTNEKILFAATNDGVARSLNRGNSWQNAPQTSTSGTIYSLAIDPTNPEIVYAGGSSDLFRTHDGGDFWTRITDSGLPNGQITDLVVDPQNPSTVYAGTGFGLYRSQDSGILWSPTGLDDRFIHAAVIDPQNGDNLFAAASAGVFRSRDAGETWTLLPLDGAVFSLAIDPATPRRVYAGMVFGGVRISEDSGDTWAPLGRSFYQELENLTVRGLTVDPSSPGRIYAATEGRGVWRIEQYVREEVVLGEGRFKVEVDWRVPGSQGVGKPAFLDPTSFTFPAVQARNLGDSGVFQFFGEENWEMLAKVLDGRSDNGRFWVFLSAASDVGFEAQITDNVCGTTKTYRNPVGRLAPAIIDTSAFADCADPAPALCDTGDDEQLCLNENRFTVRVEWTNSSGEQGVARRPSLTTPTVRTPVKNNGSGVFYFFGRDNWEMLVKVLDGCEINGRFWVFGASATSVEYEVRVTDLKTGEVWTEHQPWQGPGGAFADLNAFDSCDL